MSFLLSIFISLQRLCCPEDNEAVTIEPIHRSLTTATLFYNLQSLWCDSVTLLTATDIIMSLCSLDDCIFVCEFMKRTAAWPRARPRPICIIIAGVVRREAGPPSAAPMHQSMNVNCLRLIEIVSSWRPVLANTRNKQTGNIYTRYIEIDRFYILFSISQWSCNFKCDLYFSFRIIVVLSHLNFHLIFFF